MKKFMVFVLLCMICTAAHGSTSHRDLQKMFGSTVIAPKPQRPTARFRDEQEIKRRALKKQRKFPIHKGFFRKNNFVIIPQSNFYYLR